VIRLVVWRHGLTAWNTEGRFQGQYDTDLHPTGVRQAEAAAPAIAALAPTAIISSDLRRTAQTAAALAAVTGLDVKYDVRLRERYFGEWQGMLGTEVAERFPAEFARWRAGENVPGVEPVEDLTRRVTAALRDASDLVTAGTVVLVSHGGSARAGVFGLLGWPAGAARSLAGLDNCHYTELRHTDRRGWQLYAYNIGPAPLDDAQPNGWR
jgi:probable phosphoglycerate mutase